MNKSENNITTRSHKYKTKNRDVSLSHLPGVVSVFHRHISFVQLALLFQLQENVHDTSRIIAVLISSNVANHLREPKSREEYINNVLMGTSRNELAAKYRLNIHSFTEFHYSCQKVPALQRASLHVYGNLDCGKAGLLKLGTGTRSVLDQTNTKFFDEVCF